MLQACQPVFAELYSKCDSASPPTAASNCFGGKHIKEMSFPMSDLPYGAEHFSRTIYTEYATGAMFSNDTAVFPEHI